MSTQTLDATQRLRHYLEQMMLVFLASRTPVAEAAEHLAEIESHCIEAGTDGPADPKPLFGDPVDLADGLTPSPTVRSYLGLAANIALFFLGALCAVLLLQRLFGQNTESTAMVAGSLLAVGALSTLTTLTQRPRPPSRRSGNRNAFRVATAIIAITTMASAYAVTTLFPSGEVPLRPGWLAAAVAVGLGALTWLAISTRRRLRTNAISPQPIGVTADIIEDIATNDHWEGWLRHDIDGQLLEEMTLGDTLRKASANIKGLYRQIRNTLDE